MFLVTQEYQVFREFLSSQQALGNLGLLSLLSDQGNLVVLSDPCYLQGQVDQECHQLGHLEAQEGQDYQEYR